MTTNTTLDYYMVLMTHAARLLWTPSPGTAPGPGGQWLLPIVVESDTGNVFYWKNTGTPGWVAWPIGGSATYIGCKAYNNGTQNISDNSSTALTFNAEEFDTNGFHDTSSNTSRITIPSGFAGYYRITVGSGVFSANATGQRILFLRKNGTPGILGGGVAEPGGSATAANQLNVTVTANLAVGDYVEALIYQNSGSTRTVGDVSTNQNNVAFLECQFLGT